MVPPNFLLYFSFMRGESLGMRLLVTFFNRISMRAVYYSTCLFFFCTYTYLPEGQQSLPSPLTPVPSSSVSPHGTHPRWDGRHEDSHPDQMSGSGRKPGGSQYASHKVTVPCLS